LGIKIRLTAACPGGGIGRPAFAGRQARWSQTPMSLDLNY